MNRELFLEHVKARNEDRLKLLMVKGAAYSAQSDAFENFKRNGERLGLSKYQIWAVYCGKHLDSIFNTIKAAPFQPVDKSEGLQGRIDDAINYLELLSGMLKEDENTERISDRDNEPLRGKRSFHDTARGASEQLVDPMEGRAVD